jgi:hypothetical protein
MKDEDFKPGDPANHVLGKPDEKPAKVHGQQRPKPPRRPTAVTIHRSIKRRMDELKPVVEEYRRLDAAYNALTGS